MNAQEFNLRIGREPVGWRYLALHLAVAVLAGASLCALFWGGHNTSVSLALFCLSIGLAAAACAMALRAFLPGSAIVLALHASGPAWIPAGFVALGAAFSGFLAQSFWEPSAKLTFATVRSLLQLFVSPVRVEPATLTIGSDQFRVNIAPECSGYEGVALVLAFAIGWLWFLRHEYRFPMALVLIPISALTIWLLNSVRIATLILIGHWGAPAVALGGFHSQAGWIAFITVAIGLCVLSRRIPAIARPGPSGAAPRSESANDAAPYLMPFMAILAASMLSKTLSGSFEWLYPLRILTAVCALWYFRNTLRTLVWRVSPMALGIGAVVLVLWIALDRSPAAAMSPELAHLPPWLRSLWIGMRLFGAVLTVPIAEELAFRGFLLRRLADSNFTGVSLRAFPLVPVALSSIAFGAMHGGRWIEGTLAGAAYAWALSRKGSMGDAVAAHSFTNALLAVWVLATGQWQYW
jgi:exosortase E/protease (VPEID-CTERM system)